jgi:hypothetical protein
VNSRHIIPAVLVALAGCGLGIHVNPTVANTAPYHDHQNAIAKFPIVRYAHKTISLPGVTVGDFTPYYPVPIGFEIGEGEGAMRSWGRGKTLVWAQIVPTTPIEKVVRNAFASMLGDDSAGAALLLSGVVTEVSWYEIARLRGGRITTRVVVTRADGTPVFEGERSTAGRADDFDELLMVHAERWLSDPELVAAVQTGGAQ